MCCIEDSSIRIFTNNLSEWTIEIEVNIQVTFYEVDIVPLRPFPTIATFKSGAISALLELNNALQCCIEIYSLAHQFIQLL